MRKFPGYYTIYWRMLLGEKVNLNLLTPVKRVKIELKSEETSPESTSQFSLYCNQCSNPLSHLIYNIYTAPAIVVCPSESPQVCLPEIMPQRKIYSCEDCGKNYSRPSTLKTHKRKHTGEKPYICEICQKSFSEKGNLKTHARIHTGEKPFACGVCDSTFTTQGHLTDHSRRHTNLRPFPCECGATFMRSSTLKIHMRTHTGEKPYACDKCEKSFSESGNLKTHMRIHTGERPYICTFSKCLKAFKTKGHLDDHLRTKQHSNSENSF